MRMKLKIYYVVQIICISVIGMAVENLMESRVYSFSAVIFLTLLITGPLLSRIHSGEE
jgi:undecaprenyl pyrophosphate phosphatase UppP